MSQCDILQGLEIIAKSFGKSRKTIRRWEEDGAPIFREPQTGIAYADKASLWTWFSTEKCILGSKFTKERKLKKLSSQEDAYGETGQRIGNKIV